MFSRAKGIARRILPDNLRAKYRHNRKILNAWTWTLRTRLSWSFRRPVTLNDKIQYKMAFDRRPLLTRMADKWEVRAYVAEHVGKHVLNEVYDLVSDPRDIDFSTLPRSFVVKPTHASGAIFIFNEGQSNPPAPPAPSRNGLGQPAQSRKPVFLQRDDFDREFFFKKCDAWLSNSYSPTEWAYRKIVPRLMVERYLENRDGKPLRDYKLLVFHGKVHWILVLGKSADRVEASCHWPDWTPIPVTRSSYPRPAQLPGPPATLKEMIEISEKLGFKTDMVRVDLYEVDQKVIFGELTNYPSRGTAICDPSEYNTILGQGWTPPRLYR